MAQTWNEDDYDSAYYLLGDSVPLKVLVSKERGLQAGVMAPNEESGVLEFSAHYADRLRQSHEVEEIDKATFDKLCTDIYAKKNNSSPSVNL